MYFANMEIEQVTVAATKTSAVEILIKVLPSSDFNLHQEERNQDSNTIKASSD